MEKLLDIDERQIQFCLFLMAIKMNLNSKKNIQLDPVLKCNRKIVKNYNLQTYVSTYMLMLVTTPHSLSLLIAP